MQNLESKETLPLATPDHEEIAQRVFEGWNLMSPEERAARFSHTVACSSFDQYRYRNAALQSWICRLHEIWSTPGKVSEYRKKYLTAEEISKIDGFEF